MKSKIKNFFSKNRKLIIIADIAMVIVLALAIMIPTKPTEVYGLKISDASYSKVNLKWKKSSNANYYTIYRASNKGDFEYLKSTSSNEFEDTDLRTGTKYRYVVKAKNGVKSSETNFEKAIEVTPELETPELKISTNKGQIDLSISKVDGAIGYEIIRDGESIDKTESTEYTDKTAETDTPHKYEVKAIRYKKNPTYSNASESVEAELFGIPNFNMEANKDSIMLDWDESDHYNNYKIYKGEELLGETEYTDYAINDYEVDKEYDIKVVGFSDEGQSPEIAKKIKITEEPMDSQ